MRYQPDDIIIMPDPLRPDGQHRIRVSRYIKTIQCRLHTHDIFIVESLVTGRWAIMRDDLLFYEERDKVFTDFVGDND